MTNDEKVIIAGIIKDIKNIDEEDRSSLEENILKKLEKLISTAHISK